MNKLFSLVFVFLLQAPSGSAQDLQTAIDDLAKEEFLQTGRLAFGVQDMETGEIIAEYNTAQYLMPASSLKLLTAYAAADILGLDHRFETQVGYTGFIDNALVLQGDLIIRGGGDPCLGSARFKEHYASDLELAQWVVDMIRNAGILEVRGTIIIDESRYSWEPVPDGWTWQDIGNYYGAGSHAFNYQENFSTVHFDSRSEDGSTSIKKSVPSLHIPIENHVRATLTKSDQAYAYADPMGDVLRLQGEIPKGRKDFQVKVAIPHPARLFEKTLRQQLLYAGIGCGDSALVEARSEDGADVTGLETIESPALSVILQRTLLHSDNVFAEQLVKQIAYQQNGVGNTSDGLKAISEWMQSKGIDPAQFVLRDGSGLSRGNSVTAKGYLQMLSALSKEEYAEQLIGMLPVSGQSGSMRRVGKGTGVEGKLKAKTGYIDRVRSCVGYYEDGGRRLGVVILANDYTCSASAMRVAMSKVLARLAD